MRNNFYFEVTSMKICICTYNCPNKDMYSNLAANKLKLVLPIEFSRLDFSPSNPTQGCVILATVVSWKEAIVMLNMNKNSGGLPASLSPLILCWERHTLFAQLSLVLLGPLKYKLVLCSRKNGWFCARAQVFVWELWCRRSLSALYLSSLGEENRDPVSEGTAENPAPCTFSVLHRGPSESWTLILSTTARQHCSGHCRQGWPW